MLNKAIIGKKVGMTQIFNADGKVIPCTVIEAGPCVVTQLKTEEKDGYNAVQFGFEDVKEARLNKPQKGHLKKAGDSLKKYLKEFRFEDCTPFQLGDVVKADMFVTGDYVDVTGTSKGKGYAGVIKRFNASRLKESHGTGPVHRHAGSMGACSDPSKIMKGKMMPGHMGADGGGVKALGYADPLVALLHIKAPQIFAAGHSVPDAAVQGAFTQVDPFAGKFGFRG